LHVSTPHRRLPGGSLRELGLEVTVLVKVVEFG